ncbi:alpha and gamma adaptin binding protein p34 [Podospora appendiculata]|uniref:Alpha and gamma adaptin binding protein p34 n=1 Tax=Podospora appendiculata TaxID=314037 RepID=A0AAE0X4V2_9PEZI|nr:alpha and gamma adaptin binding protein p34 [Podospora appendiculata]
MEIANPRRILAVSLDESMEHLTRVIKDLTGADPAASASADSVDATVAGTTHTLALSTPYYTAQVPIWLDLISAPDEWAASFLSPEAKEVLTVLGGVVVVFALPPASAAAVEQTKALIAHVGRVVREGLGGWEWDGVGLAVGVGGAGLGADHDEMADTLDEWEDCCAEWGLEFVHAAAAATAAGDSAARNEFGEKTGIARVLEALQANDWSGGAGGDDSDDAMMDGEEEEEGDVELDPATMGFGFDQQDFEGLKRAIWNSAQDGDEAAADSAAGKEKGAAEEVEEEDDTPLNEAEIQKLERMMLKLQAVRDRSAGMPEGQRKKLAKDAVDEVMKEL